MTTPDSNGDAARDLVATVEAHQAATATPDWLHAATLQRTRWGRGREVPLSLYRAEVEQTAATPCGV